MHTHHRNLLIVYSAQSHLGTITHYITAYVQRQHNICKPILWVSEQCPEWLTNTQNTQLSKSVKHIQPKHYRQILGHEFAMVVYDVELGVRANPLCALIGTVTMGGMCVLWCPTDSLVSLPNALPLSYQPTISVSEPVDKPVRFHQHLLATIQSVFADAEIHKVTTLEQRLTTWLDYHIGDTDVAAIDAYRDVAITAQNDIIRTINESAPRIACSDNTLDTPQSSAVSLPQYHILKADRGRGKSYLLGRLAVGLARQVLIVTHNHSAATSIIEGIVSASARASSDLKNALQQRHFVFKQTHIHLCAPDDSRLLSAVDAPDTWLLIDEAAAYPVSWLQRQVTSFSRIVFATTVHGYENSGMGFTHRFLPWLYAQDKPTTHQLEVPLDMPIDVPLKAQPEQNSDLNAQTSIHVHSLDRPIRFMAPCPLEDFGLRLLGYGLSGGGLTGDELEHAPNKSMAKYPDGLYALDKTVLLQDINLRNQVMSCLINAHYQTSPDDLQRLLDAPDMHCYIYVVNQELIGCIWLVEEGGLVENSREHDSLEQDSLEENSLALESTTPTTNHNHDSDSVALATQISQGQRRVNGHLSLQQLSLSYGIPQLMQLNVWRINRIAVIPSVQQLGHGSRMLSALCDIATQRHIDAVTSTFGGSASLLRFWTKNGFDCVKMGTKINSVSGLANAIVIKAMTNKGDNSDKGRTESQSTVQLVQQLLTWHHVNNLWLARLQQPNPSINAVQTDQAGASDEADVVLRVLEGLRGLRGLRVM